MRSSAIAGSISVVAVCLLLSPYAALAARFIDTAGVWSEKYINQLSDQGVINAETDGKFLPAEPVTRAVFAYWLVKVLGLEAQPVSNKPSFSDVKPSDWCYKPIEIIRQNNYIGGFTDGFRPNQLITKADFIQIIARTLNTQPPGTAAMTQALSNWSDKSKIPLWAKPAVAQATIAGVILTKTPHLLEPTAIVSRGDAAAILCQLNAFVTHQNVQDSAAQAEATFPASPSQPPQSGAAYNATGPGQYSGRPSQPGSPGYYQQPQYPGQPAPYANNGARPPYYPPQAGYPGPAASYPPQAGYGQQSPYVPPHPSQQTEAARSATRVVVVNAGTEINVALKSNLDSLGSLIGQPVEVTLAAPFSSGGVVLLPAGSTIVGSVTNVVSARKLQFVRDGKIDAKFTSVQTPDGRKLPMDASFDSSNPHLPRAAAPAGTIAGGAGKKGVELHLKAGASVPIKLNQNLQVATAVPSGPPPGYSQPAYPPQYGAYPPPPVGAYPAAPSAYPQAPSGYPTAQGYPTAPVVYPSAQGGYPSAPGGYPSAPGGYPSAPGGYPTAPGGYPAAQGGYPSAPAGYPTPQQQPYYPVPRQ